MFIGSQAQTRLSTRDPNLTQLQAFEPKQRIIEGRMTAQSNHLGKDKRATLDNQLGYENEEHDVIRRTSPKALHMDLDGFGNQPGRNS